MSHQLWKFYFEDDAESFVQLLGEAAVAGRSTAQRNYITDHIGLSTGSPGTVSESSGPRQSLRNDAKRQYSAEATHHTGYRNLTLTRADINRRDGKGLTLLHHSASSANKNAKAFALSLIAHPLIDLHAQDLENGWTALHRAFYFGNITIARAILERESQDALGASGVSVQAASLNKTKDAEGNGPYDLLTATIADRTLHHPDDPYRVGPLQLDVDDDEAQDADRMMHGDEIVGRTGLVPPMVNLGGDELLTFGSNKNITLGLGNQDDRQFPERVALKRPEHLFRMFHREHVERQLNKVKETCPPYATRLRSNLGQCEDLSALPAVVRSKPITIQDVQMSKFHTAVLTSDPVSNLYICGHGFGGRLGVADERTRFNLVCVEDFGSSRKKIIAVGLGQDHTLAITDQGEVFSWGSNTFGQLGTGLAKTSVNAEEPHQLVPKQIYGTLKKELIVGVAASRIHSVVHTSAALYTFGKNEGQLGIVDAHARSLKIQSTPRRVAASRFSCAIQSVCATERATICLLETHEVHVFANYGIVKLQFPLDQFANPLSEKSQTATRYDALDLRITKVTCGGDTICALSNAGEIFAVTVDQRLDPGSSGTISTTNPNKIRDALSQPLRIWSLKKGHMSARDVAVDQDGSIIITTEGGGVWRRTRRAALTNSRLSGQTDKRSKEFKISRVPGLTRVIAVRASAHGAYCAIRSECDVTKTQIAVTSQTLWADMAALLPFRNIAEFDDSGKENSAPIAFQALLDRLANSKDLEQEIDGILRSKPNQYCSNLDAVVGTTVSDIKIPAHAFMLAGRSRYLRDFFASCRRGNSFSDDLLSITLSPQGEISILFKGLDFLTIVEFILYVYTDRFVGFWLPSRITPRVAFRYRQVKLELQKISSRFDLQPLDTAVKRAVRTSPPCLDKDFDMAVADLGFFQDGNASVQLQDAEISIHTDLFSRRCPFFKGLFQGRAGGRWLDGRRGLHAKPTDTVGVDLTHVELHVFQLVLRHIYADVGVELFDDVVVQNLDEFLDLILDVLSVANELMLDRLSQACQEVLGRYVTTRNVCQLLNAAAPCSVTEFKNSALEYICLNLEGMLSTHLLDELDEDLLHELDDIVRDNQLSYLPITKSGRANMILHDKYPQLAESITADKQAQLDWMRVRAKLSEQHARSFGASLDPYGDDLLHAFRNRRGGTRISSAAELTSHITPVKSVVASSEGRDYLAPSTPKSPFASPNISSYQAIESTLPQTPSLGPPQLDISLGVTIEPNAMLQPNSPTTNASGHSPSIVPWGSLPMASTKLGIREIMDQASTSRTSNLSLSFATQEMSDERTGGSFHARMSQKERRRQQQRQHSDSPAETSLTESPSSSIARPSPWQTASPKSKQHTPKGFSQADENDSLTNPTMSRSIATPQLTMRQTIAKSSSSSQNKEPNIIQAQQTPNPLRSVSTPQASASQATPPNQASSSFTPPVEIQSIRHVPKPNNDISTSFYMHQSLANILTQQEAEKNFVKETVAKRSLQEIQQEQEFQAWWDQERRRVMEEEAAAARAASSRGRSRGPRTGKSRGGRGRGKERASVADQASH